MDWSDITGFIGQAAPLLGGILAGPAGAAAGRLVASALGVEDKPGAVAEALKSDPQALAKVRELELQQAVDLRKLAIQAEQNRLAADTQRMLSVNATMQAEAKSEHWPQWSWRPFNGFAFGVTLFLNYALPALVNSLVLPFLHQPPSPIEPGQIPEFVFMAWGAVLGVSAWHRGIGKIKALGVKNG